MSPPPTVVPASSPCFPRVSGDEPGDDTTPPRKFAFSPRERG